MPDDAARFDLGHILIQLGHSMRKMDPRIVPGGQEDEDKILAELLSHDGGVYVDVGASHPTDCSNTYQLYQRGWRGLLIEPRPDAWPVLLSQRMGDYLVGKAASDKWGYGTLRLADGMSSLDPTWKIEPTGTLVVETEPFQSILDKFPAVRDRCEYCTIDVEGHETQVLSSVDFTRFRPRVLSVESVAYLPATVDPVTGKLVIPPREPTWGDWEPLLLQAGYKFHSETTTGLNRFYVLE